MALDNRGEGESTLYEMRLTIARKQCNTAGSGVMKQTSRHLLGRYTMTMHQATFPPAVIASDRSRELYKRGGMRWSDSRFNPRISALISSGPCGVTSGAALFLSSPFDLTADRRASEIGHGAPHSGLDLHFQ